MKLKSFVSKTTHDVELVDVKLDDLKKAVEIIADECFGAMSICNGLGGYPSPEWTIIRLNRWEEIVKAAQEAGLNLNELKGAVQKTPVLRSLTIQYALGNITDDQRCAGFRKFVKDTGYWPTEEQWKEFANKG